jgi:hypothetical protein
MSALEAVSTEGRKSAMTEDKKPKTSHLDRFEPGGDLGPIEDREMREQRMKSLPAEEQALAEECARFADLCQYFSQQQMELPHEVAAEMFRVSTLPVSDRGAAMRRLNEVLMEHLYDAGQGSRLRQ